MVATNTPTAEMTDTPRKGRKAWLLFALGVIVALAASYSGYTLAGYSWAQVVDYESPFISMATDTFTGERPPLDIPVPEATPRKVVMVLIDGLTDAESRKMQSINGLRERGNDVALTIPQPSLSYPTWTTALTGAPPSVSGVTTNWYDRRVEVETLFDVAAGSGRPLVVCGPSDLDELYAAGSVAEVSGFTDWSKGDYVSDDIVDDAIRFAEGRDTGFVFVLLPDVDEAGHAYGADSAEYSEVAAKVDADLARLIEAEDDPSTVFVVLPDHGHVAVGGHGGWEAPVINTFAAIAGPGVRSGTSTARLEDIAPTVAVLAGIQAPQYAAGLASEQILSDSNGRAQDADLVRAVGFSVAYARLIDGQAAIADVASIGSADDLGALVANAEASRLKRDRADRLPMALGLALLAIAVLAAIGIASWRALAAALIGTAAYFAVYNTLFFIVHDYAWSLSAFNKEEQIQAFFNGRMLEAVLAGLLGCVLAGEAYLMLRPEPKGTRQGFTPGWLSLGIATALSIQAILGLQVAWFLWQWGAETVWRLPDLKWGFKYDLDLIQITAVAGVAILGPVVTYLIGRFHPRTALPEALAD